MTDIKKIREFAEDAHKNQKYGENPYSYHLEHVYRTLKFFDVKDDSLLCASWLHDTIEDAGTTYGMIESTFSKDVADLVFAVTNEEGKNRKERNSKTYPKIKANLRGTILKLADRIANTVESIENNPGLLEMYKKEYTSFKEGIFNPGFKEETLEKMWNHLDKLMERV
jgi:(p)ppGpp synthase/HD superfamily hydrolase